MSHGGQPLTMLKRADGRKGVGVLDWGTVRTRRAVPHLKRGMRSMTMNVIGGPVGAIG